MYSCQDLFNLYASCGLLPYHNAGIFSGAEAWGSSLALANVLWSPETSAAALPPRLEERGQVSVSTKIVPSTSAKGLNPKAKEFVPRKLSTGQSGRVQAEVTVPMAPASVPMASAPIPKAPAPVATAPFNLFGQAFAMPSPSYGGMLYGGQGPLEMQWPHNVFFNWSTWNPYAPFAEVKYMFPIYRVSFPLLNPYGPALYNQHVGLRASTLAQSRLLTLAHIQLHPGPAPTEPIVDNFGMFEFVSTLRYEFLLPTDQWHFSLAKTPAEKVKAELVDTFAVIERTKCFLLAEKRALRMPRNLSYYVLMEKERDTLVRQFFEQIFLNYRNCPEVFTSDLLKLLLTKWMQHAQVNTAICIEQHVRRLQPKVLATIYKCLLQLGLSPKSAATYLFYCFDGEHDFCANCVGRFAEIAIEMETLYYCPQ